MGDWKQGSLLPEDSFLPEHCGSLQVSMSQVNVVVLEWQQEKSLVAEIVWWSFPPTFWDVIFQAEPFF